MNKSFIKFIPVLGLIAMMASSCADNCCTLLTAKICESDMPAGYDNWDDYSVKYSPIVGQLSGFCY